MKFEMMGTYNKYDEVEGILVVSQEEETTDSMLHRKKGLALV